MRRLYTHNLTLLITTTLSVLTLSGPVWFDGNDPVVPSSSSEEFEERIEADDVDDFDAIVDHGVSIDDPKALHILVAPPHDSPLLVHGWRWCSRGPPLA